MLRSPPVCCVDPVLGEGAVADLDASRIGESIDWNTSATATASRLPASTVNYPNAVSMP